MSSNNSSTEQERDPSTEVLLQWDQSTRLRNILIVSILLAANILTLVSIVLARQIRLHTKILVGSLTCTDTLMGLVTFLVRVLPWPNVSHEPLCVARYGLILTAIYGSCLCITAITIDRTMALTLPIVYRTNVTVAKTTLVIAVIWIMSMVLAVASLVGGFPPDRTCDFLLVITSGGLQVGGWTMVLCACLISILYSYIGVRLWQRRKVRSELGLRPEQRDIGQFGQYSRHTYSMKAEKRSTVTALALAICFILGYLPLAIYFLWAAYSEVNSFEEAKTQRLYIIIVCPLLNCILDPLVYFWRLRTWRLEIVPKCRKCCHRRPSNSSSGNLAVVRMAQQQ